MPNCLINNGLGGGIPMGINCAALPDMLMMISYLKNLALVIIYS